MNTLAIDPGTKESAYLIFDGERPIKHGIVANEVVIDAIEPTKRPLVDALYLQDFFDVRVDRVCCEMFQSYGKAVGEEVFTTCIWIGRFQQRWCNHDSWHLVKRSDVKMHLCQSMRAKDPHIRQVLIDRFGPGKRAAIGLKATPGPLYGIRSHIWSALAIAVYAHDCIDYTKPSPLAQFHNTPGFGPCNSELST